MFQVVTFGSASQDIYLRSKKFLALADQNFPTGKSLTLPADSKMMVEDVVVTAGGGGTNVAVSLANFGFSVAYCGLVGNDPFADLIIKELKRFKVNTSLVKKTNLRRSNLSVILNYPDGEKTILVYRGASDLLEMKDIPLRKVKKSQWFYLAPFAEKMVELTEPLIDFAKKNKIKVALNPGYNQLTLPSEVLNRILAKVDLLILNQEEASLLTKIPYLQEKEIFRKLDQLVEGICIMTKGKEGAIISDGQHLYQAPSLASTVVDTTGAGDSFNSGFLAGYIKTNEIESSLQLAMANSAACLSQLGAKNGLLKKGDKWPKVKVIKSLCS